MTCDNLASIQVRRDEMIFWDPCTNSDFNHQPQSGLKDPRDLDFIRKGTMEELASINSA